ncbi:unnamed protein product [Rhizophagus irregularis]|nr:unnamed protein product [Rhizophagus irregularis]
MQKQNGMSSCTETFLSIFTLLQFSSDLYPDYKYPRFNSARKSKRKSKMQKQNAAQKTFLRRRKSKNAKAKRDEFLHFIMEPREAYIERNTFCNDDDQNEGGVKISEAIGKTPLRALFYGCGRTHTIYKGLRLTLI